MVPLSGCVNSIPTGGSGFRVPASSLGVALIVPGAGMLLAGMGRWSLTRPWPLLTDVEMTEVPSITQRRRNQGPGRAEAPGSSDCQGWKAGAGGVNGSQDPRGEMHE